MGIADLDPEFWEFGLTLFALGAVSPWLSMVDPAKYGALRRPGRRTSTSSRSRAATRPVIEGPFIEKAFARVRELPLLDPPPLPDQSVLDEIVAATAVPQA